MQQLEAQTETSTVAGTTTEVVLSSSAGVSTSSQLLDSLKVYLNNTKRLQPIIGLSSIIECVKAGTQSREVLYLCEVCVCRLNKADMRIHIMGSLHRYSYIRAWHPHLLSAWKEEADLSKLAWPLMEAAQVLEGNEGPGEVQLLEVEDAVYQKMATHSENDALTLITIIRDGLGGPELYTDTRAVQPEQSAHFLSQDQETQSKTFRSEGWLENTSAGPSVWSDNSSSFLDGYTGAEPLIGLFRVVECKSEDGHTHCLLCHCCRVRANRNDIIDHLTRSSHLVNYLMESHPEQVEDINDNRQLLQSMAMRVEQEKGRRQMKVVTAPESLCKLLTGKSYNWCIQMLCNAWAHINIQKHEVAVTGPCVINSSNRDVPQKITVVLSQWKNKKAKKGKGPSTVFNVSLPLDRGSVLLERSSFSTDNTGLSACSPYFNPDVNATPESQAEDCNWDYDAEYASHPQQDLCRENTSSDVKWDYGQYVEPQGEFMVSQYQRYYDDSGYFNQSEDRGYQMFYGENVFNGQQAYQGRPSQRFYEDWQN